MAGKRQRLSVLSNAWLRRVSFVARTARLAPVGGHVEAGDRDGLEILAAQLSGSRAAADTARALIVRQPGTDRRRSAAPRRAAVAPEVAWREDADSGAMGARPRSRGRGGGARPDFGDRLRRQGSCCGRALLRSGSGRARRRELQDLRAQRGRLRSLQRGLSSRRPPRPREREQRQQRPAGSDHGSRLQGASSVRIESATALLVLHRNQEMLGAGFCALSIA
jgi:hypothetical protein